MGLLEFIMNRGLQSTVCSDQGAFDSKGGYKVRQIVENFAVGK
jgi:hypothetical protein